MDNFLMKPKIDFAFKEIMMDAAARTGFLSAVLHLKPEEIRETHILNSHLRKTHGPDKLGILDVRVSLNDDTEIDTEIQLSELKVWADRSLFYLAKMFTEQIESGEDYGVLKKCVSISILDFILFKKEAEFYSFINAERKEEFDMLASKDPYIEKAYEKLQIISQDREKRMEYEAREKAVRDYNQTMLEAEQRGETRKAIAIARNLLSLGTEADVVIAATNLPRSSVEALQKELGI